jgi:YidC/Oxa1 family membrane protein insertase
LKKETKIKLLSGMGLLIGVVALSSCTANFCSTKDKANMAYPYEQGVTVYQNKDSLPAGYEAGSGNSWQVFSDNDQIYAYIPVNESTYSAKKSTYLINNIISTAETDLYNIPSLSYWKGMDQKVLDAAVAASGKSTASLTIDDINPFSLADSDGTEEGVTNNENSILRNYGYLKFYGSDNNNWTNWDLWTNELKNTLGAEQCPDSDFSSLYKSTINNVVSNIRTCIATQSGNYGHYGNSNNWQVSIESKDWGTAWSKGLLEGLIVYPVAWLVDTLSFSFDSTLSGVGQLCALLIVTLIVRLIIIGLTFKSTLDQQKTQALQPQVAKLQAKYPNSNSNQAEQTRLQQETMALYKRNKINPLSTIWVLIVQFPVFIAVWGALQGSAVLSSGEVLNLRLSDSIQTVLFNTTGTWYLNTTGWWTALILFILMSAIQLVAMLLPQWITKRRTKNMPKTSANPAADKQGSTMKWMMWGMLAVTIIMGFSLPAAMGVYWAIGGLISMVQTLITQLVMGKKQAKGKRL